MAVPVNPSNGRRVDDAGRQAVEQALTDVEHLVRAVASRPPPSARHGWRRVELRPVRIHGRLLVQVTRAGVSASQTTNVAPARLGAELAALFELGFANWVVHTAGRTLTVRALKRRTQVHRAACDRSAGTASMAGRKRMLPRDAPFLHAIGLVNRDGTPRSTTAAKLRQVDQFVRSVGELIGDPPPDRLTVVDLGCGRAYLTLALYHYLAEVRGVAVTLTGVDRDAGLVERSARLADALGWPVSFQPVAINAFQPEVAPDLVVSLHACDTATDDALARAVGWGARWIVAIPCCHHHLQSQMRAQPFPADVQPLRQHGILFERLGDLLTDGFRASLLKQHGYAAEVHEFVEPELTARNVMLRARWHGRPCPPAVRSAYRRMKQAWHVEPYLERLLLPGDGEQPGSADAWRREHG